MKSNIPQELQERLLQIANQYAAKLRQNTTRVLEKSPWKDTGALADSIQVKVIPGQGDESPKIILEFKNVGKILELKRMTFTKLPLIQNLTDWVGRKINNPTHIPGYKTGATPSLAPDQINKRIAFAIARDKRVNDTWKRKTWKKESLGPVLREMNAEIINSFISEVEKEVAKNLSNK